MLPSARVVLMLLVAVIVFAAPSQAAGEGTSPFPTRPIDVVVLQGVNLPSFKNRPVAGFRLYATRGQELTPIPFQIDERDEDGLYVLHAGKMKGEDEDRGLWDENDELCFLASDTGPKFSGSLSMPGAILARELEIRDPLDGSRGYAYLFAFAAQTPPRSSVDYVRYDPATDITQTKIFTMGFDPEYRFAIDRIGKAEYREADNPVDILKIRMDATVLGIRLRRTQEDFNSKLGGWIDGPIRVIKYTGMNVKVVAFIRSPRIWNYTFFYPYSFSYDMGLKTPVEIRTITKKFNLYAGMDFKGLKGGQIYSSGFPKPYVVSGQPASSELQAINANNDSNDFFAVYWDGLYWLSRILIPAEVPLRPNLMVVDDAGAADPPEKHPGQIPGLYFDLTNWENVASKNFTIRSFVIVTDAFVPGGEKDFFLRQDRPLELANPG
ncbi:MAG: hypothetical protein AB1405_04520 [Bdellovibrionota bacterium]